jgi:hypothetical protein
MIYNCGGKIRQLKIAFPEPTLTAIIIHEAYMVDSTKKGFRIHAKQRMKQRFGIFLNREKRRTLVDMIHHPALYPGAVKNLGKQTCSRSKFLIMFEGSVIKVVWSRSLQEIITVLYPNTKDMNFWLGIKEK